MTETRKSVVDSPLWLALEQSAAQLAASQALLEGMTTEAKRHAARAEQLEADLARALAERMFGDPWGEISRVGALATLRTNGLPEATPDDLDAACEGLETPWGPRPAQSFPSIAYDSCEGRGTLPGGRPCPGCRGCWGR